MKFPNIKEKILTLYEKEFLKINECVLGDKLKAEFRYEELRPTYNNKSMERITFYKECWGTLKKDERGLYVESNESFTFYELIANGLTGKQRKTHYKRITKPSIFRIKGKLNF